MMGEDVQKPILALVFAAEREHILNKVSHQHWEH
jgi:hypothetical protein